MTERKRKFNALGIISILVTVVWWAIFYGVQAWSLSRQVTVNAINIEKESIERKELTLEVKEISKTIIETSAWVEFLVDLAKKR